MKSGSFINMRHFMTATRILLIVNEGASMDAYVAALSKIDVSFDIARTFVEMQRMARENPYNGLLFDVVSLVRASKNEKKIGYDCINYFPSMRIMWDAKNTTIKTLLFEHANQAENGLGLQHFIEKNCRDSIARKLRSSPRKDVVRSILLSGESGFTDKITDKKFSLNISEGGAFVHTMREFGQGDTVWLRFVDFVDQTPIKATVCRQVPWGQKNMIPGVGLKFESLSETQANEIEQIVKP